MKAAWLVGIVLLGAILFQGWRESQGMAKWKQDRDAQLAAIQAREDSADQLLALSLRLHQDAAQRDSVALGKAKSADRLYRTALLLRDSLTHLPVDTSETHEVALRALDSLGVAYDSLHASWEAVNASYEAEAEARRHLLTAYYLRGESIDSLVALVGRVPGRKWWAPQVTVGYGAVLSGGVVRTGPTVSVGLAIKF